MKTYDMDDFMTTLDDWKNNKKENKLKLIYYTIKKKNSKFIPE